ncbi:CrcB family protein (plasmid) [Rhodococcus sp. USK10]|nr:CrcB family protein [Rhodococcus sp. USK10]
MAAGGAAGAALRCQLWRWWPDDTAGFPITTFAINVVGCFFFGVCIAPTLVAQSRSAAIAHPFFVFGVLGGFTTFSYFVVQGVRVTSPWLGLLYLSFTPIAAILAALAGRASAVTVLRRTPLVKRRAP